MITLEPGEALFKTCSACRRRLPVATGFYPTRGGTVCRDCIRDRNRQRHRTRVAGLRGVSVAVAPPPPLAPDAPRRGRPPKPRQDGGALLPAPLPEYFTRGEVDALLRCAPDSAARLVMLLEWRAGLRVGEALAVTVGDVALDGDQPTVRVARGKGGKARLVPLHAELGAALRLYLDYRRSRGQGGRLFAHSLSTQQRRLKAAAARAVELGALPAGRHVHSHALRHSAARHWLATGVPINVVSRWLGHSSIQTTLIYLAILPDPTGYMDRVS